MTAPSSSPSNGPRRPAPAKLRRRKVSPLAFALLGIVGVGITLVGARVFRVVKGIGGNTGITSVIDSVREPRKQFPAKNRVNILLAGIDYSYEWTKTNKKLNGARYTKDSRSDSIMILSLDLDTHKVSALSIPRDTWVTAPDRETGKINGTFRRGGPPLLEATIQQILGIKPDYFIVVNPDSVKQIVDELGGVQVESIDAMEYNDATAGLHINLPKGPQVINGEQAIGFARFREADVFERQPNGQAIWTGAKDSEGNPIFRRRSVVAHSKEEGDPRRMARQQQLVRAMASKAKSFNNLFKLDEIVNTSLGLMKTDLSRTQIFALASLFRDIKPDQMESGTLEGKGTRKGRTWCFILDEKKKQAMVDWLLKGDESAADRITVVTVQNGTDIHGAAGRVADRLRAEGFDARVDSTPVSDSPVVTTPGVANAASANLPATRVTFAKAMVATRAQKIAQLLGVPATQITKVPHPDATGSARVKETDLADITIVLGRDVAAAYGPRSAQR